MHRTRHVLASVFLSVVALFASVGIATATTVQHGTIHLWGDLNSTPTSPIVVTGAIADYGTSANVDKDGTPDDVNGNFYLLRLSHGTIKLDFTSYFRLHPTANFSWTSATCSAAGSNHGQVTVVGGTGAYSHISGTMVVTRTFAVIGLRKDGKCQEQKGSADAAGYGSLTGSGTVTF